MKPLHTKIALVTFALSSTAFAGGGVTPELLAKGKESFTKNCVLCHGEAGDGNGPAGAMMNPKPRNLATDKFKAGDKVENIVKTIHDGLPGTGMAGLPQIPKDEAKALAYYVLSFKKK